MARNEASAEGSVDAPPDVVYSYIANMRDHHPNFLPPAFSGFTVVSGGVGTGTVISYKLTAGGRTRAYESAVAEPEPGRVLTESDTRSSAVTTFTVTPQGATSLVRISTAWDGASGIGGFFEHLFAPRALSKLLADELHRLDAYAREHHTA